MSQRRSNILCALLAVALLGVLPGPAVQSVATNVTLQSFTADTTDGDPTVYVEWATATEMNTAGFFLSRSLTDTESSFVRISPFIPAEGDSVTGSTYDYTDTTTELNTIYYYLLEVIDSDQTVHLHGPISVMAGVAVTPDPADTPTRTPTATLTPTSTAEPTHTPAATPVPTDVPTIDLTPSVLLGETITPQATVPEATPLLTPAASNAWTATPETQLPATQNKAVSALANARAAPTHVPLPKANAAVTAQMPANPTVVAMAPVVIPTQTLNSADREATSSNGPALLLISAVLLLIGGLYAILRQAGK